MHPNLLCKKIWEHRADVGLAHDGDADRVLLCDETGKLVDGDDIMAVTALDLIARDALKEAWGRDPVVTGEGGSIPVVGDFERILKAPVLLIGFGLPGENAHAPNEWISVENFEKGMEAIAGMWERL